jgi:diguanylate cyclase (GGDEF)-like protein
MIRRKIRNQYLSLFLLLSLLIGVGSAFAFYQYYELYKDSQKEELEREAYISNGLLEAVLGDATKLLDASKPEFESQINQGAITSESAYHILNKSHLAFNAFIKNTEFQSTFYVDQNGMVRASNNGVEYGAVDLADRLYFQILKSNPKLGYAVGDLVVGKATGTLAFHIATPLLDRDGKFKGLISQQVAADELAKHLEHSFKTLTGEKIAIYLNNGRLAFLYPKRVKIEDAYFRLRQDVDKKIIAIKDDSGLGVFETAYAGRSSEREFIGYATSDKYGMLTIISLSKSKMDAAFLRRSQIPGVVVMLAFTLLGAIIWRFYRNALLVASTFTISMTDSLTGLKNRRFFDTEFPKFWKEAFRDKQPISALFIDIDHFKNFNDDYGHECGDQALIAVAKTIQTFITRPLDFACRWGGEEFAVLLPETNERGSISLANEILQAVRTIQLHFPCSNNPHITVSIGIASMVVNEDNKTDDLIDMADKAMYIAKQGGRNKYAVFNQPITAMGQ